MNRRDLYDVPQVDYNRFQQDKYEQLREIQNWQNLQRMANAQDRMARSTEYVPSYGRASLASRIWTGLVVTGFTAFLVYVGIDWIYIIATRH